MAPEAVEGAKIGVLLILAAAVIGLVLSVFAIGKVLANQGVISVVEAAETALSADKRAFNQTIISGSQVLDYIEVYGNQDFAMLVNTIGIRNVSPLAGTLDNNGLTFRNGLAANTSAGCKGAWAGVLPNAYWALATIDNVNSASEANSKGQKVALIFRNYGSVIGEINGGETLPLLTMNSRNGALLFDNGFYILSGNFLVDGYRTVKETNIAALNQVSTVEYIPPAARFNSNLIITDTAEVIGVCFTQLPK